ALANGTHGSLGLRTENCQKTFEELTAKGVEFAKGPRTRRAEGAANITARSAATVLPRIP
ncbi:hypothetical protein ACWEPH_27505, partial [Nocardia beijingensis]